MLLIKDADVVPVSSLSCNRDSFHRKNSFFNEIDLLDMKGIRDKLTSFMFLWRILTTVFLLV